MNKLKRLFFICGVSLSLFITSCAGNQSTSTSSSKKSKPSSSTSVKSASEHKKAAQVVKAARSYIGTKYKYGAMSKKSTDCSGLTGMVYSEVGLKLPRSSSAQSSFGKRVYIGELERGDLIFFGASPKSKRVTHVGIVSYRKGKELRMIHASSSRGVVEDKIDGNYWRQRYIKATRPLTKL